ncbi:hypothetical protein D3C81_1994390 [compost metagenome]
MVNTQAFSSPCGASGARTISGVPFSRAICAMALEVGTVVEPIIRSTLFSPTSLRAFFAAAVLSVASSRTM